MRLDHNPYNSSLPTLSLFRFINHAILPNVCREAMHDKTLGTFA